MNDIYTASRDVWGLLLECSRKGTLMWVASAHPSVQWWAEAHFFRSPYATSRVPCALDCLEFA